MLRRHPRTRWFAVVGMTMAAALAGACTKNRYLIGAVCPMGDGGSPIDANCPTAGDGGSSEGGGGAANATFAADFDSSGAMVLGPLQLPGGSTPASLTLRGERATSFNWASDEGPTFGSGGGIPMLPTPGVPTPFRDGTLAVRLTAQGPSYVAPAPALGAVATGDFVVEGVMSAGQGAKIADKHAPTGAGWGLRSDFNSNALVMSVGDGDPTHLSEASAPIAADTWYHCLAWVSRAAGARVDCNGRPGTLVPVSAVGT